MQARMYVRIYVCMYTCMHVYVCLYICTMYVCMHVCSKWRHSIKKDCNSFEKERLKHVRVKRGLRKGTNPNLSDSTRTWQCNVCERVLLSKAGYANHLKSPNISQKQSDCINLLPSPSTETTCVICSKVFNSVSGLKTNGCTQGCYSTNRSNQPWKNDFCQPHLH